MNHYDCLKVTPDAPTEVIRAAYRALAGKLHPDRQNGADGGPDNDTHDQMAALNTAYEVLVDANLRADYDASLIAKAIAIDNGDSGPDSDNNHGFSETRVDVDWMTTPKAMGPTSRWPPSRNMMMLGGALGGVLLIAAIWVAWQVASGHQMDKALSDQYAGRSTDPDVANVEPPLDARGWLPAETKRVLPPLPPPAPETDTAQAPADPPAPGAPAASSAAAPKVPEADSVPLPDHMPTVAELSRMSDEQLLAVLPTLGEVQPVKGSFARPAYHHPLDGKPLNLRTEKNLVDPLAPEEPAKP